MKQAFIFLLITTVSMHLVKLHAQATAANNTWASTRFLGWGTTSGDLWFKTNNTTRMTLQNTTGYFGIGTTTPEAQLHVLGGCNTTPIIAATYTATACSSGLGGDFFVARKRVVLSGPVNSDTTYFIVKPNGDVGVGVATPACKLNVQSAYPTPYNANDPFTDLLVAVSNKQGSPLIMMGNRTSSTEEGGTLYLAAYPDNSPAFGVMNMNDEFYPLGVTGNGTVAMGFGFTATPIAQLELRKFNTYSYIMNVAKANNDPIMRIANTGEVGIGIAPYTGTQLTVANTSGNAYIDVFASGNKALRFMGSSSGVVKHTITDSNGDLLIDPGVASGGGNDKLRIDGKVQIGNKSVSSGTHADALLNVDGKMAAKYCVVTINNWADDVFEKNYPLPALKDLASYVADNKHLPGVPTEAEVKEEGVNVGEMNATLLRKIEELTLYALQQQKEIDELKGLIRQPKN